MYLQHTTNAYAAGLFDGEGTLHISAYKPRRDVPRPFHRLYVAIGNTNVEVLEWVRSHYGGKVYTFEQSRPGFKPISRWQGTSAVAIAFLRAIEPYVIVKRDRVALALRFAETIRAPNGQRGSLTDEEYALREEIRQLMKVRSQRGPVA